MADKINDHHSLCSTYKYNFKETGPSCCNIVPVYMYLYIFGCYKCSVTLLSCHLHHMQIQEHCKNSIGLTF